MRPSGFLLSIFLVALATGQLATAHADTPVAADDAALHLQHLARQEPILFMEDGGWCWFQDPRALIVDGKLIISGISGQTGDIRVGVYDLETNRRLGVATLDPDFEKDDHNAPVFRLREDGSILAIWAKHGKENRHYFSISPAGDPLTWSPREEIKHPFQVPKDAYWGGVTYMNLYTAGREQTLFNFFRLGLDLNPYATSSSDEGGSWSGFTHFIQDEVEGTQRPYTRFVQIGPDRIGVAFSDAHPRQYGNSLYYAEFDGERFFKADGKEIARLSDGPLRTSQAEKIYTGSETLEKPDGFGSVPNAAWTIEVQSDAGGNPHIAYSVYHSGQDQRYRIASWNGARWHDREVAFAGTHLYPQEASYTGLMAMDPRDPELVVISSDVDPSTGRNVGGKHEIYWAKVGESDDRASIDWHPLTRGSAHKNIRPMIVAGEGYRVLLWMSGPWTHFEDYDSNILGHVLARPK